jgi:hypothetical protein
LQKINKVPEMYSRPGKLVPHYHTIQQTMQVRLPVHKRLGITRRKTAFTPAQVFEVTIFGNAILYCSFIFFHLIFHMSSLRSGPKQNNLLPL